MEENNGEDEKIICQNCGKEVESWRTYCPNCNEKIRGEIESRKNASKLNICAILTLIVGLVSSIAIFINFSTLKVLKSGSISAYTTEINWFGIFAGLGTILATFTIYYICKTIIDIYEK